MSTITKRNTGFIQSKEPLVQLTQEEAELIVTSLRLTLQMEGLSLLAKRTIKGLVFKLEMSIE
jgi:hypothetical protein